MRTASERYAWAESHAKRISRMYSRCPADREDFVQEARLAAHQLLEHRPEVGDSYLLRTITNAIISEVRRKGRSYSREGALIDSLATDGGIGEDLDLALSGIAFLSSEEASIARLIAEGFEIQEIAAKLRISTSALKSRWHETRIRMRRIFSASKEALHA